MDPHIITARAYEPFIELLRANMQNCGALRIDHVMSMLRLWWIPYGETADQARMFTIRWMICSRFWHSKVNVIAVW